MKSIRLHLITGATAALALAGFLAAGASGAATQPSCSLASMAAAYNLNLDKSTLPVSLDVANVLAVDYPGSSMVESASVVVSAPSIPPIDGSHATAIVYKSSELVGAGGPIGFKSGPFHVACGIVFYDSVSGAFVGDIQSLEPVKP
jgi:hypothetical protein